MNPGFVFLTALLPTTPAVDAPAPASVPSTSAVIVAPADDLQAAAAPAVPAAPTAPKWTGSLNIGATYADGNTRTRSVNMGLDAERRSEKDRWTAKGYWNYAESKSDTGGYNIDDRRAGASLKYDYFLSKTNYLNALAGIETDYKADIKTRDYAGVGGGHQWREDDKLKWSSELGITYFKVDYNASEDKDYPAARVANNLEWKISDTTAFANVVEAFPSLEYSEDFYGKSDTKLKMNFTKAMFAQLQWVYQYNNTPADDKKRQDNLVVFGLGWGF